MCRVCWFKFLINLEKQKKVCKDPGRQKYWCDCYLEHVYIFPINQWENVNTDKWKNNYSREWISIEKKKVEQINKEKKENEK